MRKIYRYNGQYYELKKKGGSVSVFYLLDSDKKRIRRTNKALGKETPAFDVKGKESYETRVSAKILKEGVLIEGPDNQEKLF